jgi:hypothetical protein
MTEAEAADHLSIPKSSVKRLPVGRVPIDGKIRWDRVALDHWLDGLAGLIAPLPANTNQTEAEAALDRFLTDQRHAPRGT